MQLSFSLAGATWEPYKGTAGTWWYSSFCLSWKVNFWFGWKCLDFKSYFSSILMTAACQASVPWMLLLEGKIKVNVFSRMMDDVIVSSRGVILKAAGVLPGDLKSAVAQLRQKLFEKLGAWSAAIVRCVCACVCLARMSLINITPGMASIMC